MSDRSPADDLDATWGKPRPQSGSMTGAPPAPPDVQVRERLDDGETSRSAPAPGAPYKRTSLAVPALVFSIIGVVVCGFGIIGASLGALDIRAIDRGLTDPSKRRAARAALVLGLIENILLGIMLLIWLPFALRGMN